MKLRRALTTTDKLRSTESGLLVLILSPPPPGSERRALTTTTQVPCIVATATGSSSAAILTALFRFLWRQQARLSCFGVAIEVLAYSVCILCSPTCRTSTNAQLPCDAHSWLKLSFSTFEIVKLFSFFFKKKKLQ
ncbi:hypothetical protein L6164_035524 [Bauhinia variegata]|uniref:Uncharacterized protein n=1 Tax=Bauhinia variegata TaxID=167791 RepID=A0ACB9KE80_BAUVA|nr:hypothetical protein L6164_035524 [Bauhinia variegata]